jgi:hypothetical protein
MYCSVIIKGNQEVDIEGVGSAVQVILRTINSSKSAYAAITYYAAFFHNYDLFDTTLIQAGVLMKVSSQ